MATKKGNRTAVGRPARAVVVRRVPGQLQRRACVYLLNVKVRVALARSGPGEDHMMAIGRQRWSAQDSRHRCQWNGAQRFRHRCARCTRETRPRPPPAPPRAAGRDAESRSERDPCDAARRRDRRPPPAAPPSSDSDAALPRFPRPNAGSVTPPVNGRPPLARVDRRYGCREPIASPWGRFRCTARRQPVRPAPCGARRRYR